MLQKACFALALCCSVTAFSFAQSTQNQQRRTAEYSIRGKLIIPNNRDADERIEVRLEKSTLQVIATTFTDAAGNFDFRNLAVGTYTVVVDLQGYEPVRQNIDVINTLGGNSVTIFLSKPDVVIKERPSGLDGDDPDIVDISQMKESLPKKAVQDYEKALDEKRKGRMESATKLLEDAVRIAPGFYHAHNNLGVLYLAAKQYEAAEGEFKRAHELTPKADRPLVNLGRLYIEEAVHTQDDVQAAGLMLDRALDSLEQAVRLNPRSAYGYFLLGQANYRSSFLEEAEAAFKKARDIDPGLGAARLMLANIYVKQERLAEAVAVLDAYLKDNPKASDRATVEDMREKIARNLETSGK